ncbi:DUF6443 domain-containing protein [Zunongwangia pacifica]|uniref:DUF6443 domain-containing protein n=1 Tax=Zunongwangia pacifica TaxID=2911062 RepID=A0A9X2A0P5_9FLAO|nr:DUF6443 domain-containing protein [Zunongwangia pacifica]MCL6220280.1 DUF6443 domain-containing protein [Zunongwangia pacifica]
MKSSNSSNSAIFEAARFIFLGNSINDVNNKCNSGVSQQGVIYNIETSFGLRTNYVYELYRNNITEYYLVTEILQPSQGYQELSPQNISVYDYKDDICQNGFNENSIQGGRYRVKSFNEDDYQGLSNLCSDQGMFNGGSTVNINQDGLMENYFYPFDMDGNTVWYLIIEDLGSIDPQEQILTPGQIGDPTYAQTFCEDLGPPIVSEPTEDQSFETDFGTWEVISGWSRNSGTTPTSKTGPDSAIDGNYYIYIESSSMYGDKYLVSQEFTPDISTALFSFYYSMFGQGMGDLYVDVSTNGGSSWQNIWSKIGDQGPNWFNAKIDLSSYIGTLIKLRFNGHAPQSPQSDIAIDNIRFLPEVIGGEMYSSNQNYIQKIRLLEPISNFENISNETQKIETVDYYDELGRIKQSVAVRGGGNQEDIVTPYEYDALGRSPKVFLPYASTDLDKAKFRSSAMSSQSSFYNTSKYENTLNPYSEVIYENAPRGLIIEEGAPGNDWSLDNQDSHSIKKKYNLVQFSDHVRYYSVDYNSAVNPFKPTLVDNGEFMAQGNDRRPQLFKLTTRDENYTSSDQNEHDADIYVDFQNRTLLKRNHVLGQGVENIDTYYVYDDFGNLVFVLPPEANPSVKPNQTILDKFCYQYKYDSRNRLIEKKLPGKKPEYIVYNDLGQPIMSQDGELRKQGKWLFTKYDQLGRVIYTGIIINSATRSTHQNNADNDSDLFETRLSNSQSSSTIGGAEIYYTNACYPSTNISEVLTISYYDQYLPIGAEGYVSVPGTNSRGENITSNIKGLMAVTRVKVLNTSPVKWVNTTMAYDKYGSIVWTKSINEYLLTNDLVETKLDFTGKPIENFNKHIKSDSGSPEITLTDNMVYDHQGRLKKQTQKINSNVLELIVDNTFDELGQLVSNQVGGDPDQGGLQTIDYKYNIRGWLKSVNNIDNLGSDLFAFSINYNQPQMGLSDPLYNGNISEVLWRSANTQSAYSNRKRGYAYSYDELNRIEDAKFRRANSTGTSFTEQTSHYNVSGITYDKNGNILTLQRKGNTTGSSFSTMDNLVYTYNGNQLLKVDDNSNIDAGFADGSGTANDYDYDDNGNLRYDFNKKGVQNIDYNFLNLPESIYVQGNGHDGFLTYTYDANGNKLEKYDEESNVRTQYDGAFIYKKAGSNAPIIEMIKQDQGYINYENDQFSYFYNYTDHLGNVRLSYCDLNKNGTIEASSEIISEKNYYPFGLQHKGYNNVVSGNSNSAANKFSFIGKEEQDELSLDWLDFGWRNYDAALGRFLAVDAHEENYYSHTPYNYAGSSPLIIFDLDGLDWYIDQDGNYHFDPDLTEDNAEIFFNSKGFENAKYAFASSTINSGKGLNEETGEFEELLSSFTLNADGTVVDNLSKSELEVGEMATTAKGTQITAFDEDSYTSYDQWVELSGEDDPSGVKQGLHALGIGATIEKTTTSKVTKNPWFLVGTFGVAVAQKQSSNLAAWEKSLTPRERKALEKRRKEIEKLQQSLYSGYGGEGRE